MNGLLWRGLLGVSGLCLAGPALAVNSSFHLMQIEQVIGGVEGDTSAQAIQLRMRAALQNQLQFARMFVHDATGSNPVLLIDFTTAVPNQGAGVRVLITSPGFAAHTDVPPNPDFIMTNLIPESYLAAGSLTFESDTGFVYWRLSWGGSNYTGPNNGTITNDPDGDFGPPYPGVLPSLGVQALQFQGPATAQSTTNLDDYDLTASNAVFTNNAGQSSTLVGACTADLEPDGVVDVLDLLLLLGAWGPCPGCPADFNQDDVVDVLDLLDLLSQWGACG